MAVKACPQCKGTVVVIDSRPGHASDEVCRRRYKCINGHRFSTVEIVVETGRVKQGLAGIAIDRVLGARNY